VSSTGIPEWAATSTLNYWQRNLGALAPLEITNDLLVGSNATSSALIRLPGISGQKAWFNTGGNLGVGTTNPGALFDVAGLTRTQSLTVNNGLADGGEIQLQSASNNSWNIDNYNGTLRIFDSAEAF